MSDVQIHPTAIIDPGAEIGAGTIVGPYCVIGCDVVLGPNCWLQHHVTLCGPMKAGAKNKFYAYCSIGQQTQDLKYRGEPTYSLTVISVTIAPWAITSFSPITAHWVATCKWATMR